MTSRDDIGQWFDEGVAKGATHLIVACDAFDHSDYPVFVMPGEDPRARARDFDPTTNMQRIMEVYCLKMDKQAQLREHRAFHWNAA